MVPQRKSSPRLRGFDYRVAGYYFITICTFNREPRFGNVRDEKMILNSTGRIIERSWQYLPDHYSNLKLDEYVIMPNHFHAIAILEGNGHELSEIVRGFKTRSARRVNRLEYKTGFHLWQRSFYDHVIRDDRDLDAIREYIVNNPLKWELDNENPDYYSGKGVRN